MIKYYCSFSNTIYDVLASRGWCEVDADEDVSVVCICIVSLTSTCSTLHMY